MPQYVSNPSRLVIRLALHGCVNRPFYHIVVSRSNEDCDAVPMEQVGTYDPMPNSHNEKLVALNYERVGHWLAEGAGCSKPVLQLLGMHYAFSSIY